MHEYFKIKKGNNNSKHNLKNKKYTLRHDINVEIFF